ncbi:hypothetical protein ACHAXT_010742 [Thalassiosira profunda]
MDNSSAPLPAQDPVAEDDRKPAAVPAMPSATSPAGEVHDVPAQLHFQPGERIEVKWTINDDESEDGGANKDTGMDGGNAPIADDSGATVWWPATLNQRTDKVHTLTEQERQETDGANLHQTEKSRVSMPVYSLNYSPLAEFGFDTYSLEEVAFITDKTLLNLSTDEIMVFRKAGAPSPPPSPVDEAAMAVPDASSISREFHGEEEMSAFLTQLMQSCLRNTGMDRRMNSLPASEQMIVAERIKKAQEGMLEAIKRETGQMEAGKKVVTADVVRRCMEQMRGAY